MNLTMKMIHFYEMNSKQYKQNQPLLNEIDKLNKLILNKSLIIAEFLIINNDFWKIKSII